MPHRLKILVLTNLYPPHHAGTFDFRCQTVTENLKKRGHEVCVLTSTHGLTSEQRDREINRRLTLAGVHGHPPADSFKHARAIAYDNHRVLRETLDEFQPELAYVWSLSGLSKSLVFALRRALIPAVYDVADGWMIDELPKDAYLRWWNQKPASFVHALRRFCLELIGRRNRLDKIASTRMMKGYDRQPVLYGPSTDFDDVVPNSVTGWPFEFTYFCSEYLKGECARTGLQLEGAAVIYPGLPTDQFYGEIKPESTPVNKLLMVSPLDERSGAMTVLHALLKLREQGIKVSLSVSGRGDTDYMAEIRSFAVRHTLPVEFLNLADLTKDLPGIYRKHDAFVYSAEWNEPFSTHPLEAMACGVPVIGSKIGGAREVFKNGENAWVFAPGDVDDLVRAIKEVREQPAERIRIAEAAQGEVLAKFNESAITDQIEYFINASLEIWQMK